MNPCICCPCQMSSAKNKGMRPNFIYGLYYLKIKGQIHEGKGKENEVIRVLNLDFSHADFAAAKIRSYGTPFLIFIAIDLEFIWPTPAVHVKHLVHVSDVRWNDILRLLLRKSTTSVAADTLTFGSGN